MVEILKLHEPAAEASRQWDNETLRDVLVRAMIEFMIEDS